MSYWFIDGGGGWRFLIPHIKTTDTVVGSNPQINRFFKEIIGTNVVELKTPPSLFGKSFLSVIPNIIRSKLEYRKYFKDIWCTSIYLHGGLTTITWFSYINKMSKYKANSIYLVVPNKKNFSFYKRDYHSIYTPFLKFIGLLMGVKIGITENFPGEPNWYMRITPKPITDDSGNLIEKSVDRYGLYLIKMEEPNVSLPEKYTTLLNGKDTLLLLGYIGETIENPLQSSNEVANLLDKKTTIIKNHIRDPEIFGDLKSFDVFPSFIPAEILINALNCKNIISVYPSKSLYVSTKSKKISMYRMFNWVDPVPESMIDKYVECGVKLPKTKEEFITEMNTNA
jgi:hypothetical protein